MVVLWAFLCVSSFSSIDFSIVGWPVVDRVDHHKVRSVQGKVENASGAHHTFCFLFCFTHGELALH